MCRAKIHRAVCRATYCAVQHKWMAMTQKLSVYIDYKSPYAFLAMQPARELEKELSLQIDWLPYSLQIDQYLGEVETRNAHQWRRVKYSYMDARRLANEQGLIVRGPQKLFDSSLAHIGLLFAKIAGPDILNRYHDIVFDGFFKRELNIENLSEIKNAINHAGAKVSEFEEFHETQGQKLLEQTIKDAEDRLGIFGVPTFVIGNEIFWGGDQIDRVRRFIEDFT